MGQDNDNFITQGLADLRNYAWSKAKDIAARGSVITTAPGAGGRGRPGGIDIRKMAEDQAQAQGRGDPALRKKKKPAVAATPPLYKTISDDMAP